MNIAEQPQQAPGALSSQGAETNPSFLVGQHSHSNKTHRSSQGDETFTFETGLQKTYLLKNSQDNDKLPPDPPDAARSIIHVAELKGVGGFTVWGTHLGGFYDFPDKKEKRKKPDII